MTARVVVDMAAFAANLRRVRTVLAPARHVLVVKDDAYGHGLSEIAAAAAAHGVTWFGAYDVRAAVQVRAVVGAGPRIIAWTVYDDDDVDAALDADVDLGLGTRALVDVAAGRAAARHGVAHIHLKVDSGLHRNGIRPEGWPDAVRAVFRAQQAGTVRLDGVWSHIAEASDAEDDRSRAVFLQAAAAVAPLAPLRHLAASAASFARPGFRFDLARVGAYAYGIRPSGGPADAELGIRPIATLVATVTAVAGGRVTVDAGALHGLDSRLAGRLAVGVPGGTRVISRVGDDVRLSGGDALFSATDVAEMVGSIGEQVLLRLSPRLPRVHRGA